MEKAESHTTHFSFKLILYYMEILIVFCVMLFAIVLSANIVLFIDGGHKYFKKTYDSLPSRTFYLNIDQVYDVPFSLVGDHKSEIVWFVKVNDFKVSKNHYLHNQLYTYCSPYHLYWLIKYTRWFKKNVDINKIEKY